MDPNKIIDALGGSLEVSRLCEVTVGAVSQWRTGGIPRARLMFLRLLRPDLFPDEPASQTQAESGSEKSDHDGNEPDRRSDREPPHVLPERRHAVSHNQEVA